jgi:hypothetical protein
MKFTKEMGPVPQKQTSVSVMFRLINIDMCIGLSFRLMWYFIFRLTTECKRILTENSSVAVETQVIMALVLHS